LSWRQPISNGADAARPDLTQADDEELNRHLPLRAFHHGGYPSALPMWLNRTRWNRCWTTAATRTPAQRRIVDVLLESSDALRLLLPATKAKVDSTATESGQLHHILLTAPYLSRLRSSASRRTRCLPPPLRPYKPFAGTPVELHIGLEKPSTADGVAELFHDIPGLGKIEFPRPGDKRVYR
jgi:hypothetical protein